MAVEIFEPNITSQLINVQSELKVPKSEYNSFGGYHFRSAEGILEAVKPILLAEQLALTIVDELISIGDRYYVKATAYVTNTIGQKAEATAYAREPENQKGMNEAQITGSASSYARKYALNGLFAIDDTKDPDATNDHKTVVKKPVEAKVVSNTTAPATPKQKQAIFSLLNSLHIVKSEQAKYLADNFNVDGEMNMQLASDIIGALKSEVDNGN